MKLSEMQKGTYGTVSSLGSDQRFINRITSVGLTEGARFQVVKNDRKMPVLVYVRETLLALNRRDCEKIETAEVNEK
ncbi:MAG: ferrous iron transport protein A [Lachnospiraceae bacterium]|nr:ferrous iron transport protein A [Lachnospiraceae bacterium]